VPELLKKIPSRPPGWAFPAVALAAFVLILATFANVWTPQFGLTRLINVGRVFDQRSIGPYRETPKYIGSPMGFDGQHYAQIALDPLMRDPQIRKAIDDPAYRGRRILLPWLAWLGGLGHPAWVLNLYASLNAIFWLGYAVILIVLFRPHGWPGLAGFAAMLLTCGVVESMRNSLVDFPSFVMTVLAMMIGGLAGAGWMAAATLARPENSLLALPALFEYHPPWGRTVKRNILIGFIAVTPAVLWIAYLLWRLRGMPTSVTGGNLDWPLHAIYIKLGDIRVMMREGRIHWNNVFFSLYKSYDMNALLTVISTLTQCVYVLTHRDWRNRLWRMGALFVPFFICIHYKVWSSHFTVTRHALPITLAFNLVLAMRPRRTWLLWFLLGNCFVPFGIYDFYRWSHNVTYSREEFAMDSAAGDEATVHARFNTGWSNPEWDSRETWRWAVGQQTTMVLTNPGIRSLDVELDCISLSLVPRDLRIVVRGTVVWLGRLEHKNQAVATLPFSLPPGGTMVTFVTSQPAVAAPTKDVRELAFMVAEPRLTVIPPATAAAAGAAEKK
jgi:hypothetical protein